jgi:hypothetical protein
MRFATIARVNEDSTVNLAYGDDDTAESVATLFGYTPVQYEQVVVADVDGEPVVMGAVFNSHGELG